MVQNSNHDRSAEQQEQLIELLIQCTVRIDFPGGNGTGFFVAEGLILTCWHVAEHISAEAKVVWQSSEAKDHWSEAKAEVSSFFKDYDLALLKLKEPVPYHPCVYLENSSRTRDVLYCYGYPESSKNGDSVTFEVEGKSFSQNRLPQLKVKQGQADYGLSGSPLLNLRTGGVCGMVNLSRDVSTDLGGRAVPTKLILEQFRDLQTEQRRFHRRNRHWLRLFSPSKPTPKAILLASLKMTMLILVIRFIGMLQPFELLAYDILMSLRPPENMDSRILVVEITRGDFTKEDIDQPEISNNSKLKILKALEESYSPQVVGLDIYIDRPKKEGNDELVNYIRSKKNIIACCLRTVHPEQAGAISPRISEEQKIENQESQIPKKKSNDPRYKLLKEDRLGFTNTPSEDFLGFNFFKDLNFIRRYQLTIPPGNDTENGCKTELSLGFILAKYYLDARGIKPVTDSKGYLGNGKGQIQFENKNQTILLEELEPSDSAYQWRRWMDGYQVLLNYRSFDPQSRIPNKQRAFDVVTATDITNVSTPPDKVNGRVVLIGYEYNPYGNDDSHHTPFSFGRFPIGEEMPGVHIHAHLVSQILSSVLDSPSRLQLKAWSWETEGLWIWGWALIAGGLVWLFPGAKLRLLIGTNIIPLSLVCFLLLWQLGFWVPLVPSWLAIGFTMYAARRDAQKTVLISHRS
jgi:CHASE2 domain-containing sensor protein